MQLRGLTTSTAERVEVPVEHSDATHCEAIKLLRTWVSDVMNY